MSGLIRMDCGRCLAARACIGHSNRVQFVDRTDEPVI